MPLNSITQNVKGAIDKLTFPSGLTYDGVNQVPSLQAHISIPIGATISDGPHAFVWGAVMAEERQTMAGGRQAQIGTGGFREAVHRIHIVIRYALPHSMSQNDSCVPGIIDSVLEVLRGVTMPQNITDPQTGRKSTIMEIGEKFDVEYGQVYYAADERYWIYGAKITMRVKEVYQQ